MDNLITKHISHRPIGTAAWIKNKLIWIVLPANTVYYLALCYLKMNPKFRFNVYSKLFRLLLKIIKNIIDIIARTLLAATFVRLSNHVIPRINSTSSDQIIAFSSSGSSLVNMFIHFSYLYILLLNSLFDL